MSGFDTLLNHSRCWFLRNVALPAGDLVFGQKMMKRVRFLEKAQWWNKERLHDHRNRALNSLIEIAYEEVDFYQELMKEAGVKPEDIQSPCDIQKLPIVTKDMLREGYPEKTSRKTGQATYESCSAGSTGKNICILEDAETAGWYRASLILALEWTGWQIGEKHLQTGMTLKRSLDRILKDRLMQCFYVSAYDLSDSMLDSTLGLLEKHRITHLWGYAGSLYLIGRRAIEKGWNQPLRSVVSWGDNLYEHYRRTIENAFKARVFDTYGCGEGIHIAAQCGRANTYHIHTLDVIVECLDDDGKPVTPGDVGNIVLTRLHPGPMPLIRYQVGDIGILSDRSCDCGRGFDILESIQGRDTDVVVTPSGNRLIVHFFTGVLEHFQEIDCFQVIQENTESMLLRLVPTKYFSKDAEARIVAALREKGAEEIEIKIELAAEIPLPPSGKRRFVVNKTKGSE